MKLAVASGKGGTGKTTVATNLAYVASHNGRSVAYLDCDVEEPNGHLFLKPDITDSRSVGYLIPEVDDQKCTYCGECGEICRYSAIVCISGIVLLYPELCHGCGGCRLACAADAITEVTRATGRVESGQAGPIRFVRGVLDVGEAMSPPVIRAVRRAAPEANLVIADAAAGTSCPVIESIRASDLVLLVTEPTPFGLHDVKLAVDMVGALKLPFAVVINRADLGDARTRSFFQRNQIPILEEIPDDRKVAEAYSRGVLAAEAMDEYRLLFERLLEKVTCRKW